MILDAHVHVGRFHKPWRTDDATADLVCCYKPQIAFYEALGIAGLASLQKTMEHIRSRHPGIPVILDMKRSDVAHTNRAYAKAADGTAIPISLVYRKDLKRDGASPMLLYGYGAYGASIAWMAK